MANRRWCNSLVWSLLVLGQVGGLVCAFVERGAADVAGYQAFIFDWIAGIFNWGVNAIGSFFSWLYTVVTGILQMIWEWVIGLIGWLWSIFWPWLRNLVPDDLLNSINSINWDDVSQYLLDMAWIAPVHLALAVVFATYSSQALIRVFRWAVYAVRG